jgi:hypothetical protein
MPADVAAGDGVGEQRPDHGDDDANDDLCEPTLHARTMPRRRGETMESYGANGDGRQARGQLKSWAGSKCRHFPLGYNKRRIQKTLRITHAMAGDHGQLVADGRIIA